MARDLSDHELLLVSGGTDDTIGDSGGGGSEIDPQWQVDANVGLETVNDFTNWLAENVDFEGQLIHVGVVDASDWDVDLYIDYDWQGWSWSFTGVSLEITIYF